MSARRYALKPQIALEAGNGGHVLVDTRSATLCSCNDSAWIILEALRQGASLEVLVSLVTETYDVDQTQARTDALDLINRLGAMGFIDEAG